MSLLREYVDVPPEEELHPSQMKTVGEILDLIERIQEETDEAGRRARSANVGIEFIKIAMGEIPLVGGALGAADGLFAMYAASKNEEHTWAELEEYPILARMKMHPSLAKHLDPVTLREIDKAYQDYLRGLGRETRVSEIADIDNFARDWIMGDTDSKLSVELLREYIQALLTEDVRALITEGLSGDNSAGPGFKRIFRGMKIDMPTANLASHIRKIARNKPSGLSEREAGSFIMAQLKNEEIGESWTTNMDVASHFADVWSATNRGKTLHVMFWGKVPNDFGYDPTTTGEELYYFEDESEVRIPKGEEIEITSVNVFIADKKGGKNWIKFRPVAYSMGKVKA
jgi:hypothetical protein